MNMFNLTGTTLAAGALDNNPGDQSC